jgi:hypothetical protein
MSLTIDPWSFPAAEFDPKGEGEKSIVLGGGCFWHPRSRAPQSW